MNRLVFCTSLIICLFLSCNKVRKVDASFAIAFIENAAFSPLDSVENNFMDLRLLAPDGANQIGFFYPYQLALFIGSSENKSLSKLAEISKSRHLDRFWCMAFFKDDKLLSFVDIPRAKIDIMLSNDSSSNGLFYFSDIRCKMVKAEPKVILQIFPN